MPYYRVTFPLAPGETIEINGVVIDRASQRVCAQTWERAVLLAAADVPVQLAPAVYHCLLVEGFTVQRCD